MKRRRRRMPKLEEIEELDPEPFMSVATLVGAERVPDDMQPDLQLAANLVEQISPMLAGKPLYVQSIVLAELLSIWVCGFHATAAKGSDPRVQERFRERMLRNHIRLVRELVQAEVMADAKFGTDESQ